MHKAKEPQVEARKQVIYDWIEQEKMTVEEFLKGFNSGHKLNFQDYTDEYKYLAQLSNVLCHMIVNHELDLSKIVINKQVKGKEIDDEDDLEDLGYFYICFFKELKKEIEKIEDETLKTANLEKLKNLETISSTTFD